MATSKISGDKAFSLYSSGLSVTVPVSNYLVAIVKGQYNQSALFLVASSGGVVKVGGSEANNLTAAIDGNTMTLTTSNANYARWIFVRE